MMPRCHAGLPTPTATALAALVWLGGVASWSGLAAQVGYPPGRSPYHDIKLGNTAVFNFGHISGTRGRVGVGPSDGNVWGFRVERALGRVLGAFIGIGDALTSAYVVDPTKDSSSRTTGPVNTNLVLLDAGMLAVLTGAKSWHGFAPFVGASVGFAYAARPPGDSSEYRFGVKITFGPQAGMRWYVAPRLSVRADAKLIFWRLSYPLQYKQPSTIDGTRVLPLDANLTEWTTHPWISVGVGWTF